MGQQPRQHRLQGSRGQCRLLRTDGRSARRVSMAQLVDGLCWICRDTRKLPSHGMASRFTKEAFALGVDRVQTGSVRPSTPVAMASCPDKGMNNGSARPPQQSAPKSKPGVLAAAASSSLRAMDQTIDAVSAQEQRLRLKRQRKTIC